MITVDQLPLRIASKIRLEDPPADPAALPVSGPCWTFTGRLQVHGYGDVTFGRGKHNRWLLHRWTYTQFVGPIPNGLQTDHRCRNRACCNPAHLEPVTAKVNQERGIKASATHCRSGRHELSGHNLILNTRPVTGYVNRECRACKYESQGRSVRRRRGVVLPEGDPRHGITGYMAYQCRCAICKAAGSASNRRAYLARRANRPVVAA